VTVVTVFVNNKDGNKSNGLSPSSTTLAPSPLPTTAPTAAAATARARTIAAYINGLTLAGRTLVYPSAASTEERALQWLIDVDETTAMDDTKTLRQRYALATLWFTPPPPAASFGTADHVFTWTSVASECQWFGVTCQNGGTAGGRVTGVRLKAVGLAGRIPPDLALLTDLTDLDLADNSLTGPLPSSLGDNNLTALSFLELSKNKMTGTLPLSWTSLSALTGLWVFHNDLTGPFPETVLTALTALNKVHAFNNQWVGTIPSSLGTSLTALTELGLSHNLWTGTIPASLGQLTRLQQLFLHQNQLTGTIPSTLGALTALTSFHLYSNRLSGTVPFCNNTNGTVSVNASQPFVELIADCKNMVICPCCTHCCPGGFTYC
jgi:hypothetical protein